MWSHFIGLGYKMFCCTGFRVLIGCAGQEGISAVVGRFDGGFQFQLQCRAIPWDQEDRLLKREVPLPSQKTSKLIEAIIAPMGVKNIKLSCSIALAFCPYCGSHLTSLVKPSTRNNFVTLAEDHKIFLHAF